jgi:hypothetical protein
MWSPPAPELCSRLKKSGDSTWFVTDWLGPRVGQSGKGIVEDVEAVTLVHSPYFLGV